MTRYVFIVEDLHLLLLAGLPAHYQTAKSVTHASLPVMAASLPVMALPRPVRGRAMTIGSGPRVNLFAGVQPVDQLPAEPRAIRKPNGRGVPAACWARAHRPGSAWPARASAATSDHSAPWPGFRREPSGHLAAVPGRTRASRAVRKSWFTERPRCKVRPGGRLASQSRDSRGVRSEPPRSTRSGHSTHCGRRVARPQID